ncbi:hypothetical protein, partial [Chryseobacterium sp. JM1]
LSYGFFKNRILDLLFSKRDISEAMDEYKTLLKSHIVPIRPARSHQRNTAKYKARAKPIITKNHKDSL